MNLFQSVIKLIKLWKKSSDALLKRHSAIRNVILSSYKLKKSCRKIKSSNIEKTYKNEDIDSDVDKAYRECRKKFQLNLESINKQYNALRFLTQRNENLLKKTELAKTVATVNAEFRVVLEEELQLLKDLKEDLDLFNNLIEKTQ